jgi:hypothetical protein
MDGMENDVVRQRKEKASPEVRSLYEDLQATQGTGAEVDGPEFQAFEARIEALSPSDRADFVALLETAAFASRREIAENRETIEKLRGAERVFEAAHEKLRAEGKPIDPDMTLGEAYEVLGLA